MEHNFERFRIRPELIQALQEQNISKPTEIQERLIPSVLRGVDVIGKSQTGTGKTLAFVLPLLTMIDTERKETQVIITAPTRELARQLFEVVSLYAEHTGVRAQLVIGGLDRDRMLEKAASGPQIIVGTPGRVLDMMNEKAVNASKVKSFVVDEADQMLDLGFLDEVNNIAGKLHDDTQLLVFSATIPESLMPFLKKYMKQPKQVEVQPKETGPANLEHWLVWDKDRPREEVIRKLTTQIQPFLAIIFANTKESADRIYEVLLEEELNVDLLHGGVAPRKRKKVLKRLQDAEVQYLVATDLIARGIDITGVSHIINAEIPTELEYYTHRVGRTARAGWGGQAITLYGRSDDASIAQLKKKGTRFIYKEWKKGQWVTVEKRSDNRPKQDAAPLPPKKKKNRVKPAYKKKAREKAEREHQRERRINRRQKNRDERRGRTK
ncbi:DEAD/DEAH box helicase [Alkalicoccus urumqiensis]|uniref:DEAD/DEAH box helicase n=1 Tax=Alkalicoccus urumqiensis TaxID=1548213 RepID=A0A2P6MFQ2_ALKUR|nr:DEAD/DEAH box helicase [Alkalicoccus urumqiensis]PRO65125.1 DEAD/DEAH box helicase [Alkalicoccus urumqiensis]